MLNRLSFAVRGTVSALYFAVNTLFWCVPLYVFLPFSFIGPKAWREFIRKQMVRVAETWTAVNSFGFDRFHRIKWIYEGEVNLDPRRSYLVTANHRSWTDIVILQKMFNHKIPFLRFFIKRELIYVPLLGLAWYALDFPRMKRHSREYLERHPEKRGEDLKTTRRICAKLRGRPISIINFLEGTRFTPAKHARQNSPFRHLLKPKVGGLAFVLEAMGDQFDSLLDVTIEYPAGAVTLWGLLSGRMPVVRTSVREIAIPREFSRGDYLGDEAHRAKVQAFVQELWAAKDARLAGGRENHVGSSAPA